MPWKLEVFIISGLFLLIQVDGSPMAGVTKKNFKMEKGGFTTMNSSLALDKGGSIAAYLKNLKCDSEKSDRVQVSVTWNITKIPCALPVDVSSYYSYSLKTTRLDIIHDCSKAEHEPIKIYNVTVVSVYTVEWGFAVHDVGLEGEVVVEMKNNYGYLSAVDYPFWQLYIGMVVIYCFYALAWMVLMVKYRNDLIRIQYWIGAVIGIGLVESCVYFSTYNIMNNTGVSTDLIIIAELLVCLKRTFAVMVLIIASSGFGIVKPRLGPLLTKVLLVGVVYFALCGTEGYLDATTVVLKSQVV